MTGPPLDLLRRAEVLAPLDVQLARALARLGGDDRPEVLLGVALASRAVRQGHVCLDVRRVAGTAVGGDAETAVGGGEGMAAGAGSREAGSWPDADARSEADAQSEVDARSRAGGLTEAGGWLADAASPERGAFPEADLWLAALGSSPLVGDGTGLTPLVLEGAGRLYLWRYWDHERRLAACLRARVGSGRAILAEGNADSPGFPGTAAIHETAVDLEVLRAGLDRLFDPAPSTADGQRIAAMAAVLGRLTVITGGPGTGKTATVVRILALLVEQSLAAGRAPPRALLLAPTGKAAARLSEAVRVSKDRLPCADAVRAAIPGAASTIHRALGVTAAGASGAARFRHDAADPLLADVVLVDEASMVDIALMRHLVEAVPPHARLILLGDQDQLASVEAGAVLGDICNAGGAWSHSRAFAAAAADVARTAVDLPPGAPSATGIWDHVARLTHSFRFGPASGIGRLARAVNAGDADAALEVLRSDRYPDVTLVAESRADRGGASAPEEAHAHLRPLVVAGYGPYLAGPMGEGGGGSPGADPAARLAALDGFRVLCAHRRGPRGVEGMNAWIEAVLAEAGLLRPVGRFYGGRPVLVTQNDYSVGLFNGDLGLAVPDPERPGQHRVCFPGPDGQPRLLPTVRLPAHETAFAMSIHRAQGSEFGAVAVLLPDEPSPLLTRELLYTAVTRARHRVTLFAAEPIVRAAIGRQIERASGLRERLWGAAAGGR